MNKIKLDSIVKIIVLILMLIFPCVLFSESFYGKCVGVSDGDTISIMNDGRAIKIRINGIDCPEMGQDFGRKAKQFTSDMVFGKYVEVHDKGLDKYGRTIAVVFIEKKDLGLELIKAGLAWHYKQYSSDLTYTSAEQGAIKLKNGLWSFENPISPWDFRHNTSKSLTNNSPTTSSLSVANNVSSEVYITNTGAKYHSAGCRYLSKSAIPISLKDAITRGYSPCSVCGSSSNASSLTSTAALSEIENKTISESTPGSNVVYITNSGAKYHSAGCRYLSKSAIPINLKDVISRGYSPCSVCSQSSSANSSTSVPSTITGTPTGATTPRGHQIYVGPRGGLYHYSKSGKKVYERKKKY